MDFDPRSIDESRDRADRGRELSQGSRGGLSNPRERERLDPLTDFLARSSGKRGRVARRGKRGSNHDDGLALRFARWSGSKRPSATRECRRRTRNCSDVGRPCPRP